MSSIAPGFISLATYGDVDTFAMTSIREGNRVTPSPKPEGGAPPPLQQVDVSGSQAPLPLLSLTCTSGGDLARVDIQSLSALDDAA